MESLLKLRLLFFKSETPVREACPLLNISSRSFTHLKLVFSPHKAGV